MTYISDVFCQVCDKSIAGPIRWHDDLLVCEACHKVFDCERQRQIREVHGLSWPLLLIIFGISLAALGLVDTWPLVDGIAILGAAGSAGGMALKLYGKARG